ncbi:hypothetical protein B7494_g4920 [Chlorociboria aeruginascens]|nr:hypothetical protein B7494_g4920 [Chlorociboria aeruginascens]
MEDAGEDGLDGSSIKPVSSLRSHFEQMAGPKPSNNTIPRTNSPKPARVNEGNEDSTRPLGGRSESVGPGNRVARGREREGEGVGLRAPKTNDLANMSPSPSRGLRLQPTVPPAVTVQPPQSPSKAKALALNFSNGPAYLSAEARPAPSSAPSSPRHFRVPSRPHTPLLNPDKSTISHTSQSQPPSPPPPRRSGEFRRDAPSKSTVPPPVNRSEKPKIGSKPISLSLNPESTTLAPLPLNNHENSSPFNTPSSSDNSTPENEFLAPTFPRSRHSILPESSIGAPVQRAFEPPPIHHSVVSKRRDQETNGLGKGLISPQTTGDLRPALPTRPPAVSEISRTRALPPNSMMPPPPRSSLDRNRSIVTAVPTIDTRANETFSTPPKRVFSTPTSQLQTPPRSHGRSMTVDRTSDRTPAEFRAPAAPVVSQGQGYSPLEVAPSTLYKKDALSSSLGDYPDSSRSNRRPPLFKQGAHEIATKYDTRIFDVCGELVCTSGHLTRVWNLLDGENIMTLSHTEGVKIISVAFKPTSDINSEGSRLWLGSNIGELLEVDIASQSIVATKSNAHTRREVIKIYRHLGEMWTLDDGGTLHLWAPDGSGSPNLTNPYQSFRVPKGHTFSILIGHELWHATGKDIRVFVPTLDGATQFQVLQRPLNQTGAGDVTSGTIIHTQPDRVYFGHADGKISLYSRRDYSCLGIITISVYKITSLAAAGSELWAGFSTGMIYVYDTTVLPWVVRKEWRAHQDPLICLLSDRSSFWKLDRSQVVSLGQDNTLRIWDGLLMDDWIETRMRSQEEDFCELESITTLVMTWNAGASTPYRLQHSEQDSRFFRDLLQNSNSPDILVFSFQELVDLEDKKTTAKSFFKSKKKDHSDQEHMSHQYRDWRDFLTRCLDDYMPNSELYHLLHTASLVGLFTCIFVRAPLRERIHNINGAEIKRGMGGLHGNKGAIIVRFVLDNTSLCFINCHLAAGQTQTRDRNADITAILESTVLPAERDLSVRQDNYVGGGDGTMILDHEICVLNGDLNYRIDTMGRDTVINAIKTNNLNKLLERDQLLASKRKNPWFRLRAFHELPIAFAPTYKYDVGTDNYDTSEKKRAPAWCDRLMYRGGDRIEQLNYQRHEVRVSDHRPVTGVFQMVIKTISPKKRALKLEQCQQKLSTVREKLATDAQLGYLVDVIGFDAETSKKMVQQRKNGK